MREFIKLVLTWLMRWFPAPEPLDPVHLDLEFSKFQDQFFQTEENPVATQVINDNQQFVARIEPKSKKGNPARVDGVPTWESSDPTVVSVHPSEDGLSALVKAVGPVGAASVKIKADADLGEGVSTIEGSFNVAVEGGAAADFGLAFDSVEEQPAPVEPAPVDNSPSE